MAKRPAPWEAAPIVQPQVNEDAPWLAAAGEEDAYQPGVVQPVDIAPSTAYDESNGMPRADNRPTSFRQGFIEGAEVPWNNAARALEYGAEQIGIADGVNAIGQALGLAGSVSEAEQSQQEQQMFAPVQGSTAGRIAGGVAGTLPTAALPGGAFVQGAAGGALMTDDRSTRGLIKNTILGGVGGVVGDKVLRAGAALAAPRMSEPVRTLVRERVSITPGQRARSADGLPARMFAAAEDRATSLPGVGDMIARDRLRSVESLNTAAVNRALSPINAALPPDIKSGRRAVRYAGDKLSAAYDEILPKIGPTRADEGFAADISLLRDDVVTMLPEREAQFERIVRNDVERFIRNDQTLDGTALKEIETRLGRRIRQYAKSQDPDQRGLGEALQGVQAALRDVVARNNPLEAERLQAINQGWASLVQVERAALRGKDGQFGAQGYSDAVRATNSTTRQRGYARGEGLNQDLSDAASSILPSQVPDSGTAGRWAQSNLLALGLGVAGTVPYTAARGVNAALSRERLQSEALARLLQYGAQAAPVAAPAAIDALRRQ